MSWLPCSYCGDFADTDGNGEWDVKTVKGKTLEFVCGVCTEKYMQEDGVFNPDLPDCPGDDLRLALSNPENAYYLIQYSKALREMGMGMSFTKSLETHGLIPRRTQ